MQMKTSELTGAALDWAVAKCEGISTELLPTKGRTFVQNKFSGEVMGYSRNWSQGGPIIEREEIEISLGSPDKWVASIGGEKEIETGPTPLVAAMRCYVASKLGDTVEIPEELKGE